MKNYILLFYILLYFSIYFCSDDKLQKIYLYKKKKTNFLSYNLQCLQLKNNEIKIIIKLQLFALPKSLLPDNTKNEIMQQLKNNQPIANNFYKFFHPDKIKNMNLSEFLTNLSNSVLTKIFDYNRNLAYIKSYYELEAICSSKGLDFDQINIFIPYMKSIIMQDEKYESVGFNIEYYYNKILIKIKKVNYIEIFIIEYEETNKKIIKHMPYFALLLKYASTCTDDEKRSILTMIKKVENDEERLEYEEIFHLINNQKSEFYNIITLLKNNLEKILKIENICLSLIKEIIFLKFPCFKKSYCNYNIFNDCKDIFFFNDKFIDIKNNLIEILKWIELIENKDYNPFDLLNIIDDQKCKEVNDAINCYAKEEIIIKKMPIVFTLITYMQLIKKDLKYFIEEFSPEDKAIINDVLYFLSQIEKNNFLLALKYNSNEKIKKQNYNMRFSLGILIKKQIKNFLDTTKIILFIMIIILYFEIRNKNKIIQTLLEAAKKQNLLKNFQNKANAIT